MSHKEQNAYSYRSDQSVPDFTDEHPICVMDANCSLCAKGAAWIARHDRLCEFRIIALQSPLGIALIRHYGLEPDDPASWLYIVDGYAYKSIDAFIRVANRLGGIWRMMNILKILPRFTQDFLYFMIARNRYRMFGKTDLCSIPNPEIQKRLLR